MPIAIRNATAEDAAAIADHMIRCRDEIGSFLETPARFDVQQVKILFAYDGRKAITVCVDENQIFGVMYVVGYPQAPLSGVVYVSLDVAYRGMTNAATGNRVIDDLYAASLAASVQQGLRLLTACISPQNEASNRLFARKGFLPILPCNKQYHEHKSEHVTWIKAISITDPGIPTI